MKIDFVTLGESMVLVQPLRDGGLAHETLLSRSVGGAESNVAIALSRLGKKSRWVSRLGVDPFGDLIEKTLRSEGVDTSFVARDENFSTAVFFREIKAWGEPHVYYYRQDSAASRLSPADVCENWLRDARHLHVTGITPALSESAREAVVHAMKTARELGLTVSFDPNLRRKLWSENEARETLLNLIPLCDIFLPGMDEAKFLLQENIEDVEKCAQKFLDLGPKLVVIKQGEQGAAAFANDVSTHIAAHRVEKIVDSVGAGDAFAAGLLSVLLDENSLDSSDEILQRALRRANLMGALATQFRGDWEGLPTLTEIEQIENGEGFVSR